MTCLTVYWSYVWPRATGRCVDWLLYPDDETLIDDSTLSATF